MSIKSVLVCITLLLFTVSGFGQVFHKVDFSRGTGGVGVLRISNSASTINGATCASNTCAEIPIDGTKLPEYLMACLNKMEAADATPATISFSVANPGNIYTFTYSERDHKISKLEFYNDVNGTNIKITMTNGRWGIIRLAPTALWHEQRKTDYLVSMLVEAIPFEDPKNETQICFSKDANDIITSMTSVKGATGMTCP